MRSRRAETERRNGCLVGLSGVKGREKKMAWQKGGKNGGQLCTGEGTESKLGLKWGKNSWGGNRHALDVR